MSFQYFFFAFLSLIKGSVACKGSEVGDVCNFGIVKLSIECEEFLALSWIHRRKHEICGFDKEIPLICCRSQNAERKIEKTTRPKLPNASKKAADACKNFGERPVNPIIVQRVINGKMSEIAEFPHFAALGYQTNEDKDVTFNCGGALISNRFVITAAHCCRKTNLPVLTRLGRTALNLSDTNDTSNHKDIKVKTTHQHINYRPSKKHDDIALIELEENVIFAYNIWPACLNIDNDFQINNLIIAGFGQNNVIDNDSRSTWLMKASVNEISLEECRSEYERVYHDVSVIGLHHGINDDLLCAKNRRSHVDTCQGDSGSPLQLFENGIYYVIGITSFGVSCNSSLPSFYTRVSNYIAWIENIVWP